MPRKVGLKGMGRGRRKRGSSYRDEIKKRRRAKAQHRTRHGR